jgi:hypothetical protein
MSVLPPPADAARVSCFLAEHVQWSAWWDKRQGVWHVAEDDPDSDLYAESSDVDTVIGYISAHGTGAVSDSFSDPAGSSRV